MSIFIIFLNLKFFYGLISKLLNIVLSGRKKSMNILQRKKCQSLKNMKKKLLDGSSRSSEFFLVKQNPIFDLDS